uniref:Uncharacterized protein n=1 Tax=Arundo donax TaxID=35708 RepID=A0A0A9A432_ARUDO
MQQLSEVGRRHRAGRRQRRRQNAQRSFQICRHERMWRR